MQNYNYFMKRTNIMHIFFAKKCKKRKKFLEHRRNSVKVFLVDWLMIDWLLVDRLIG